MKHARYTLKRPATFLEGKWVYETNEFTVRIMATAEGYAMVRRPRGMPFVVQEKELRPLTQEDGRVEAVT